MIPIEQHSVTITKKIVGKFNEDIPVRSGFGGFFPAETTPTLMVDVEVQRDNDLIAVDVMRFTEGNKTKYTKATEHTYIPPFFKEDYDFARDEVYMNTVALGAMNVKAVNATIAQNALKAVRKNRQKIERATAKQQADVLQSGIVTLKNGDSIDFRRKAASIVDLGAGNYWNEAGTTPSTDLGAGMTFLRNVGNSTGSTVNVVMRGDAMDAFLANESMKEILNSRRMDRAKIVMPQFNEASGMAFHGQVSAGDFTVNLWTYNEKYTDENGATQFYLARENAIIIPNDFQGKTVYGGLPYLRKTGKMKTPAVAEAQFLLRAYDDEKTISSTLELTSAPLAIPFTIDKVYTLKVLADL